MKSPYKKRLSSIWGGIYARTHCPSQASYEDYKDIKVKYNSFIDFYDDQIDNYINHVNAYGEKNTTIDRINPYGDYESSNLRWATRTTQNSNKKYKVYFKAVSPEGKIYYSDNQADFSREYNLTSGQINNCIYNRRKSHKGWIFEKINEKTYYENQKKEND